MTGPRGQLADTGGDAHSKGCQPPGRGDSRVTRGSGKISDCSQTGQGSGASWWLTGPGCLICTWGPDPTLRGLLEAGGGARRAPAGWAPESVAPADRQRGWRLAPSPQFHIPRRLPCPAPRQAECPLLPPAPPLARAAPPACKPHGRAVPATPTPRQPSAVTAAQPRPEHFLRLKDVSDRALPLGSPIPNTSVKPLSEQAAKSYPPGRAGPWAAAQLGQVTRTPVSPWDRCRCRWDKKC